MIKSFIVIEITLPLLLLFQPKEKTLELSKPVILNKENLIQTPQSKSLIRKFIIYPKSAMLIKNMMIIRGPFILLEVLLQGELIMIDLISLLFHLDFFLTHQSGTKINNLPNMHKLNQDLIN